MTTHADDAEIEAVAAREIHVTASPAGSERPIMLTIGVYGRNGRGGTVHGILLKREGALLLLQDLADSLGVELPFNRESLTRRATRWPRRRAAHWLARRALTRAQATRLSERELLRRIFDDQIPAQRTASTTQGADFEPATSQSLDNPARTQDAGPLIAASGGALPTLASGPH